MSEAYLKKIFKTIEKFKLIEKGDKVFVALSGGKDSASALFALKEFQKVKGIDFDLNAFHINLGGITSDKVQEVVEKQADLANIQLFTYNLKEKGISLEKISKKSGRPICSACGVIKRYLINKIPRDLGATKVATGHHADDFTVFFFKNLLDLNFSWIGKFRPKVESENKKLLTKIRPLFFVRAEENEDFCKSLNIPFLKESICPYFPEKIKIYDKTKKWYDVVYKLDEEFPEFREKIINSIEKISKYFYKEDRLTSCKLCGEPTNKEICAFCRLTKRNH
jgi:tRNA(Ile)-lysidine synthase TilS/MesJ